MNRTKIATCFGLACCAALYLAGRSSLNSPSDASPLGGTTDKLVTIRWQRLLDTSGQTCDRCGNTEQAINEAQRVLTASLRPLGLRVTVEKAVLTPEQFAIDPTQSNKIWIGKESLGTILGAKEGATTCAGVCGNNSCRTMVVDGRTYETIPPELIVRAGLKVAADMLQPDQPTTQAASTSCCSSSQTSVQSCSRTQQPTRIGKIFDTNFNQSGETPCCDH